MKSSGWGPHDEISDLKETGEIASSLSQDQVRTQGEGSCIQTRMRAYSLENKISHHFDLGLPRLPNYDTFLC